MSIARPSAFHPPTSSSSSRGASASRIVPPTPMRTPKTQELLQHKLLLSSSKKSRKTSPRTPSALSSASQSQRKRYRQGAEAATSPIRVGTGSRIAAHPLPNRRIDADNSEDDREFFINADFSDAESDSDSSDEDLPEGKIPGISNYGQCLGKGHSSEVYEVVCRDNQRKYALKRNLDPLETEGKRQSQIAKLRKWDELRHSRIVRFLSAWQEDGYLHTLMHLCEEGSLQRCFDDSGGWAPDETFLLVAFRDVCSALDYLHSHKYAHLDVKPANICIRKGKAMLCDLELLTKFNDEYPVSDETYASKEAVLSDAHQVDPSADIFSLGITFLELASRVRLPKEGPGWHALRTQMVDHTNFPDMFLRFPDLAKLVARCMHPLQGLRPSASALLKDPVFARIEADQCKLQLPTNVGMQLVVDNRPASASLFTSSPRESSLSMSGFSPRDSGLGLHHFSFQTVAPSPTVSRAASRTASPHPMTSVRLERRLFASPSPQILEGFVDDALSHQFERQAAVTPRPSGGMTPSVFPQSNNRASSPRIFGAGSPLIFQSATANTAAQ